MGMSLDSEGKRGLGPSIELITKSAAVCIGFLYVCGFLVVTIYLCLAPDLLDSELSVFMRRLRAQGAAGEPEWA